MKKFYWMIPMVAFVSCQIEEETDVEPENTVPKEELPEAPAVEEETGAEPEITAPEEESAPDQEETEAAFDVNDANSLVGQALAKVEPALKAAEIKYRVVERDGQSFPVTLDFQAERLNFKISNGVITAVTKG